MKQIVTFILLIVFVQQLSAQSSRIKALTTESTYAGTLMIPCDKSTYSVHKKIYLSTISDYIIDLAADRDTAIQIWERGGATNSIQAVSSSDTAYGDYSVACGYNTEAGSDYSLAHGINTSVTEYPGARVYSSGTGVTTGSDGWAQNVEISITGQTTTSGGTDTMLCGGIEPLDIRNNYAYIVTVKVLGVAHDGLDLGKTYLGVFNFMAKQVAGTTSIGTVDTLAYNVEAGITAAVTFAADDTNERLIIGLTGTDGGLMYWYGEINIQMIRFD